MKTHLQLAVCTLWLGLLGCPVAATTCSQDDECGLNLVCDRDASQCVDPPGDCAGYCLMKDSCGVEDEDDCIKAACGASFLQYYRDQFGEDCEDAWLDLMECESNLSCAEWEQFADEVNASEGTAPYCEAELQAKNDEC